MKKIRNQKAGAIQSSPLYHMSDNAFKLMREGKEIEARKQYPMEYHVIKKYNPSSEDELTTLLGSKLRIS